jgi:hypothetical protein
MKTGDKVSHKKFEWAQNMDALEENNPGKILCIFKIDDHPVFAEFNIEDLVKISD